MKQVINAFHPDYMKTYEPNFMKYFRTHEANRQAAATLSGYVEKVRQTKPSHGTLYGISKKVLPDHIKPKEMMSHKKGRALTMLEVHNDLADKLKRKEFHVYAKAGTPKEKKK
jgi:hypothetical protein